jgi:hypothetical protein
MSFLSGAFLSRCSQSKGSWRISRTSASSANRAPRNSLRRLLRLEALEDRSLLAPIIVTSAADSGANTLRQAILDAHPGDQIRFDPSVGHTITLTSAELEFPPTGSATPIEIIGPGADQLTISGNNTWRVFTIDSGATADISGLTISSGRVVGDDGAGIANHGALTITDCTVSGNSAGFIADIGGHGGGIVSDGTITLTACTISANSAGRFGGGISSLGGILTLSNCLVAGNSAPVGGGICIDQNTTATISDSTVSGNGNGSGEGGSLSGAGIAVEPGSNLTLIATTISDNTTADYGGGIYNAGTLSVRNSSITKNKSTETNAGNGGGGIYVSAGGTLDVFDSTIAKNSAALNGGGICQSSSGRTVTIYDSTIAENSAASNGGGICRSSSGGAIALDNTIIAGNTGNVTSPDIRGVVTADYCLIQNLAGASITGANNIVNRDPLLDQLRDNGGPTETMALLGGSPCIDSGNNDLIPSGATTDQRGYARILSGTVDMGAYEYLNPLLVTTAENETDPGDGLSSLCEAIDYINSHGGNNTITFDPSLAGQTITLTDGELALTDTTGTTTITGLGAGPLTISGNHASRVFNISTGVTADISGLTIANGYVTDGWGGGILNNGTVTISNCTISDNSAAVSGAPRTAVGGAICNEGTLTITHCTVTGNHADGHGGGIGNYDAIMTMSGCIVSGNSSTDDGGGVTGDYSMLTVADSIISGNSTSLATQLASGLAASKCSTILQ